MTRKLLETIYNISTLRKQFSHAYDRWDLMSVYTQAHLALTDKDKTFYCSFNDFLKAIGE